MIASAAGAAAKTATKSATRKIDVIINQLIGGEPGTRTLNLAVKSRLLCQIELAPLHVIARRGGLLRLDYVGWTMGLEPTTTGITTRGSTS